MMMKIRLLVRINGMLHVCSTHFTTAGQQLVELLLDGLQEAERLRLRFVTHRLDVAST